MNAKDIYKESSNDGNICLKSNQDLSGFKPDVDLNNNIKKVVEQESTQVSEINSKIADQQFKDAAISRVESLLPFSITKNETNKQTALKNQLFQLRFHIFVPPEIEIDLNTHQVGIFSKLDGSIEAKIFPGKCICRFQDGHIFRCKMTMSIDEIKNQGTIEYKYLVIEKYESTTTDKKSYLVEYLGSGIKNRFLDLSEILKTNTVDSVTMKANLYDGLMLPPNQDSKQSEIWSKINGLYYSSDLIAKYADSTCEAMLFELHDEIVKKNSTGRNECSFRFMFDYLNSVFVHLRRFFNTFYNTFNYYKLKQIFFATLMQILNQNGRRIPSYLEASCTLYLAGCLSRRRIYEIREIARELLRTMKETQKTINLKRMFGPRDLEIIDIPIMKEIYDYVSFNSDSLYLLELIVFLLFDGNDRDRVEFYSSEEFYQFFTQIVSLSLKSKDVIRLEYRQAVQKLENPSTLEKSLFVPFYYADVSIKPNTLLGMFNAEHFLFFLYVCLQEAKQALSDQNDFYLGLCLNKKKRLVDLVFDSLNKLIQKEHVDRFAIDLIHFLSEQILKENETMSKFCDNDQDLNLSIVLVMIQATKYSEHIHRKLKLACTQVDAQLKDTQTEKLIKMIQCYRDQLTIQDNDILYEKYLRSWSRVLSIYEFSDDDHFKENLNSFIIKDLCWNSLFKLEINNLIRLVKVLVEKKEILSVYANVKKVVFDAIIANVDKIEKNHIDELVRLDTENDVLRKLTNEIVYKKS